MIRIAFRPACSAILIIIFPVLLFAQQTKYYDDPDMSFRLGSDLIEKKQFGAAQKVFEQILEILPAGESLMRLDAEFYDALCDYNLNRPEAGNKFNKYLQNYPDHTKTNQAHLYIGYIEYDKRKYRKALERFELVDPYQLSPEQLPEYLYKKGFCFLQQDDFIKAREVFFPILNTASEYSEAVNYYYAHIAFLEQRYGDALQYFERVSEESEFSNEVPFFILQIHYIQNNYKKIMEIGPQMAEVLKDKQQKAEAARIIAEAYYVNNRFDKALEFMGIYNTLSGKSLTRNENYQLAYSYYQTGDFGKAIGYFQKVTGEKDDIAQNAFYHLGGCYLKTDEKIFAQNAFYAAWQLDADPHIKEDALFNYAKLTFELAYDPFNNSISALTQYITDYPGSERMDEAYSYLTSIFLSTKDYQAAINAIEGVRIKNDELRKAYQRITYRRAIQLFNAAQWEAALENFRKSLANNFDAEYTARARYWTAETYFEMGNFTRAIDYYDRFMVSAGAYDLDIYPMTKYNLGYAYFNLKYYDNALIAFSQFTERPSSSHINFVTDAVLRMGDCYFVTNNYKEAIAEYNNAIQRNSTNSDYALFQKALSEGALGNHDQKIITLQELINNYPQSAYQDDAWFEKAESFLLLDDNYNALENFTQLISQFPNSSYVIRAILKSGLVYYNQNDYDNALEKMKLVVNTYPGAPESKEALATIRNIYIEQNEVEKYYDFAQSVPFANVTANEQDSITYLAAENIYVNNYCEGASKAFADYLQKFPNGSFVLPASYYKAECDYKTGKLKAALESYSFVLQYPKSQFTENALVKAGQLNYDFENFDAALKNYLQLEQIADYPQNVTISIAGQMRSNYMLQNFSEAIANAEKLLQRERLDNDQTIDANYIIAKSALALDDLQLAAMQFQITNDLSEGERGAEAKYMMVVIQFRLKNYQKAEDLVFELANEYPSYEYWKAKGFIMLAEIYVENDNVFQAKQTLQSIIDHYPGKDLKQTAAQRLEQLEIKDHPELIEQENESDPDQE
jgi:TolA-binding protein